MELYYKCTTWNKIIISDKYPKELILEKCKKGLNPIDIGFDEFEDSEWENITETEEYLYPEDNEGDSTMELLDENGNTIWDNSNLESIKNKKLSIEQVENIWKECYGEEIKEQYEGFYNKLKGL
jgi:hypothetical protein